MKRLLITLTTLLFSGSVLACAHLGDLHARRIWARPADKGANSAIYMHIENEGKNDDALLEIKTDVADKVELHKTVTENGVSSMVKVDKLAIPAGSKVKLAPKGLHVMLLGLKQDLKTGNEFEIELVFEKAGSTKTKIKVKEKAKSSKKADKAEKEDEHNHNHSH
jgi:copper(I)-binding protein